MPIVMLLLIQQKLLTNCYAMLRRIILLLLPVVFIQYNARAQEDEVEVDTAALQKRLDSEYQVFKVWSDSVAMARGRTSSGERSMTESGPAPVLSPAEQLQESERKLAQFKKIIIWLFVLVMAVGVLLSKPWKKGKTGN